MSEAQRILVRGPNWVGDLVMSTPGFRALRAAHPEAHIALQVRPGLEPLLAGAPWFDEVIPLESREKGLFAMLREGRSLRRRGFDLGVCIPDSFSSALLMRLAGVRRVVGHSGRWRTWLLHHRVTPDPAWGTRRMVARERFVLNLTSALDCPEQGTQLELFTTAEEEAHAAALLGEASGPLVAIAPGASFGSSKLWPATSFARVGDELSTDGARVVLIASPDEVALAAEVEAAMRGPVINLAGQVGLGSLKAVMRRCSLLVCNDAGARHVATAFGVPCVVLFGPTSLEKTNLNLERVTALETDHACRPCYARECPIDHRCMTKIDVQQVLDAGRKATAAVPA